MSKPKTSRKKMPAATVDPTVLAQKSPADILRKLSQCFGLSYTPKQHLVDIAAEHVVARWIANPDAVVAFTFRQKGVINHLLDLQKIEGDPLLTGCALVNAIRAEAIRRSGECSSLCDANIILSKIIHTGVPTSITPTAATA